MVKQRVHCVISYRLGTWHYRIFADFLLKSKFQDGGERWQDCSCKLALVETLNVESYTNQSGFCTKDGRGCLFRSARKAERGPCKF